MNCISTDFICNILICILSLFHFSIIIQCHLAKSLFYFLNFTVISVLSWCETISFLVQQLEKSIIQMPSSNWNLLDCVRNSKSFIDRDCMWDSITTINNCSSCFSTCIKRKHSLNLDVKFRDHELLKEKFCQLFSVFTIVLWAFCDEKLVVLRLNLEFLLKEMLPNFSHIRKVDYSTLLDRVIQI